MRLVPDAHGSGVDGPESLPGGFPSLTWRLTRWVAAGIAGGSQGGPALPHPYMTTAIAIGLAIAAAVLWLKVSDGPDGNLHVHFLDIGQGDSTLIVTPSGNRCWSTAVRTET